MESDLKLKYFLIHDNNLQKSETKLYLDFIKCKLDKCYSNNTNILRITHQEFESCKEVCFEKIQKINLLKEILYRDFNKFYYEKFLTCSNISESDKYDSCIENNKLLMKKNTEEIKKIILNYSN